MSTYLKQMQIIKGVIMAKKIVHYKAHPEDYIVVGRRACVLATDHPIHLNEDDDGGIVATSTVLNYHEGSGDFETENTLYRRIL